MKTTKVTMHKKIAMAIEVMKKIKADKGIDFVSPTEIGREVGNALGREKQHSAFGSPICKSAVEIGLMKRSEQGWYALTEKGLKNT